MDTGLDQDQAELAILVLAVALEVLADGDSLGKVYLLGAVDDRKRGFMLRVSYLLDEHVEVLWDLRGEACTWVTPSVT